MGPMYASETNKAEYERMKKEDARAYNISVAILIAIASLILTGTCWLIYSFI